ncbi:MULTISPECIES: dihydrolipoamide acetyltransferase family protein [Thermomonas]|jgi:pyruvate dehydrogenase E2 component (dihydrolipoamide acetyltransferase)|uniref:Dihydrolipoamide acetyltransferase component of pyruvate dehydrogenase complex n=3 Tax=Thermomonas TaxID=141948 RepID=A0ABS7TFV2_9GAMM|nr:MULTISPECIES: dihydrolipoamide acetyltransferase family protein [Thermomonas]MBS0459533.1 2-oxo acid dehydrogenase subunit E2 [Pseudomonadota bacterium]MBZ4186741.1 2-oxo acid dehydrogenase subunit E2 [Thermomonas beijingensis]HQA03095.1 dihydrolipoamide acetyltransferase family protein [Thermomonas sp.]HQE08313.1 dihydrolipoamide acetyltransferase family protein [Thermomonas sp.]
MSKKFFLPDLGEGLPDATIVEWHVNVGDVIRLDENLVSMETAKAVVDVPSPVSGKVLKLAGAAGDVIVTGHWLAEFELDMSMPQRAEGQDTGHHHGGAAHAEPEPAAPAPAAKSEPADAGTVVGAMQVGNAVVAEAALAVGGVKAVPAVRATARKLGVDLARVRATGPDGTVTMQDVKQAAANPALLATAAAPAATHATVAPVVAAASAAPASRSTLSQSGKPMRTQPPGVAASGQPEQLKGVRRNMARVMADAHAKVVPTTLVDDADLHAWIGKQDITARLIRAIVTACKTVPALNAWFDGDNLSRTLHPQVDIGIAVDTDDGLFVPALRNADMLDARGIREGINRLRTQVEARTIPASELSGYTISLSNFGMFAGRYATPVVVPPCVAIVGAGKLCHDVVAVIGGIEVHRRMPISLTFDHRACTGGEAARFLKALLDDLGLPQ